MFIKKISLSVLLGLLLTTSAFAGFGVFTGPGDWRGEFTFQTEKGERKTVFHSPYYVKFLHIIAVSSISLCEGSSMNGFVIPADVTFRRTDNVDLFTKEVQKLGVIIDRKIELGPTYTG